MRGKLLTLEQAVGLLREHLASSGYYGAQSELARAAGIRSCSVSQALSGRYRPNRKLLKALGLRRIVLYEVIGEPVAIPKRIERKKPESLLHVKPPPPVPGTKMIVHRMVDQ